MGQFSIASTTANINMKSVILLLVILAVYQVASLPQFGYQNGYRRYGNRGYGGYGNQGYGGYGNQGYGNRPYYPSQQYTNPAASGNGAGFGTGNAGPNGVSATGVAIASAQNGGSSFSSGNGFASSNPFSGYNAGGTGNSQSFGK